MSKVILTGIKPTGMPHLGNYTGAVRPALRQAEAAGVESFLFIANYHSLTTVHNPAALNRMVYEVSAAWLACGLEPERVVFYRQSDIPEVFELSWILSCLTPKGLMNRAHSYKAFLQDQQSHKTADMGINMGVFNYPVLMAADILLFSADEVPVSEDQAQHLEIARDLALKFNHTFKTNLLKAPKTGVTGKLLPGLDGRKMSKTRQNHIPLFSSSKELEKLIRKIKTDSSLPSEPKDPNQSDLFTLYKAFADEGEVQALLKHYKRGIGWGEVKDMVFKRLDVYLRDKRKRYEDFIQKPEEINRILKQGAEKARQKARLFMQQIRRAIGITC